MPDSFPRPVPKGGVYLRLLQFARPYLLRLSAGFLFGLIYALSNYGLIWFVRGGFKEVFNPSEVGMGLLLLVVVLLPVISLVRGAADFLSIYCIQWVGNRVVMDLRNRMFEHVHDMPVGYFTQSRTGELISRVTNDTGMVERAVSVVVGDLAKQPLTLVGMLVWVFVLDPRLATVSLIVFPLCLLPISAFGSRVRRYSRQAQERIADVVSILQETVSGVRIVKAFGMERYETGRFSKETREFFSGIMRVAKATAIVEPIIVVIATAGIAVVLIYVRTVRMQVYDFVAFIGALFMMYEPVKKLSKIYLHVQQSSAAADRIFEVLDAANTIPEAPDAVAFEGRVERIEFEHVHFTYGPAPVLRDIHVSVRAGERVAIVGSSGAGKTTLVNLLPRFYDVTGGRVLVNGADLRGLTLASLRRLIGLVTQETFLFNDTIANNIGYGSEGVTRERIEAAARQAHAHEFISEMPDGYETVVGERGVRLSGGQRQRLAIARAVMRDPQILILDEATSALDTESERMVQAALEALMKGRTVFAIAHRLSTITNCDRILVLDNGLVAEEGRHEELLARNGLYRRLYDIQFDDARSA